MQNDTVENQHDINDSKIMEMGEIKQSENIG